MVICYVRRGALLLWCGASLSRLRLSHSGIPHCDVPKLSQSNLFYTLLTTVFKCDLLHVGM